jgi:hypothetical protein
MQKEYDLFLPWKSLDNNPIFARITPENIFRLNPHWVINSFGLSSDTYSSEITDHESEQAKTLEGSYRLDAAGFPVISAEDHDWQLIRFFEKDDSLHISVTYGEDPPEEVETLVVLWFRSIKEYLRLYTKNSINTRFFRFIMNRVILQMNPSQRKISLMLIRLTMLEILLIVALVVGWFFFFR